MTREVCELLALGSFGDPAHNVWLQREHVKRSAALAREKQRELSAARSSPVSRQNCCKDLDVVRSPHVTVSGRTCGSERGSDRGNDLHDMGAVLPVSCERRSGAARRGRTVLEGRSSDLSGAMRRKAMRTQSHDPMPLG